MKFLENANFDVLNCALSSQNESYTLDGRVESYSCKMTSNDKRLFKSIKQGIDGGCGDNDLHALSPPDALLSRSPSRTRLASRNSMSSDDGGVGFLCDTISTKSLFYLISTLNASFAEYDFSDTKADEFSKEPSLQWVMNTIDSQLKPVIADYDQLRTQLWAAIDDEISLNDCDSIYSYNPDLSSDPFGESGQIWGLNYFFYNRKLKRMILFTCRCSSGDSAFDESNDLGYSSIATADLTAADFEDFAEN